jgi:hypothetical protein
MKKVFILAGLLSFTAQAVCHQGSNGAINLFGEQQAIDKKFLEAEELTPKVIRVTNEDSCGIRGCQFGLFVVGKGKCVKSAFVSESGRIIRAQDDWKEFTLERKNLPVDIQQRSVKTFFLNKDSLMFEEKPE